MPAVRFGLVMGKMLQYLVVEFENKLSHYIWQNASYKLWIVLCIEFFALWSYSRTKGRRFAYNVIAVDLADKDG